MNTNLALLALLTTLLAGCIVGPGDDSDRDNEPPFQTRILEVRVTPDPVAVGDTATFTVVIEDSLDPAYRFTWDTGEAQPYRTDENRLQWVANVPPRRYRISVRADNGDRNLRSPVREFYFTVK